MLVITKLGNVGSQWLEIHGEKVTRYHNGKHVAVSPELVTLDLNVEFNPRYRAQFMLGLNDVIHIAKGVQVVNNANLAVKGLVWTYGI